MDMKRHDFESSIKCSDSYPKLIYMHGEKLFIFDDGKYKIAAMQLAWEIYCDRHDEIEGLRAQQAKVEELQLRNQMLSDSTLEMGSKHIRDTDLINQQASTLFRLREFIYGSGDLREYSDEELVEHQRILKVILAGEQALKGEGDV